MPTLATPTPELFQAAHRVWTGFNAGLPTATVDFELLKSNAGDGEQRLRIDQLAWAIIARSWA